MTVAKPLFSIITVILNDPDGFQRTAESIVRQTNTNFEWIVIDGASEFKTIRVIESYRHSIDHLVSEPDEGIYDAMMKGARLASGQYINFMNAGDCFACDHVLASIAVLPKADLIYGQTYWMPQPGIRTLYKNRPIQDIWQGNPFSHQSVFCRTAFVKELGFRKSLKIVADYDFYLRALERGATSLGTNFVIAEVDGRGLSARAFYRRTFERFFIVRRRFKDKPVLRYYFNLILRQLINDIQAYFSKSA